VTGSGSGSFQELSNRDSNGTPSSGSVAGAYTVNAGVTDFLVQAAGNESVQGQSSTTFALFGANSNVQYNVTGGSGSIYAAGGNDSIYLANFNGSVYSSGADYISANNQDGTSRTNVNSYGNDTINLLGAYGSTGVVNADGAASTAVFVGESAYATVSASGSAAANVFLDNGSGSQLVFINNSSKAQFLAPSTYLVGGTVHVSNNIVTVYGGASGGVYAGGAAGGSLLVGGEYSAGAGGSGGVPVNTSSVAGGIVTLYAGGNSDTLYATGYTTAAGSAGNVLYGSQGSGEKLLASASTGNNTFQIGFYDAVRGWVQASAGLVSTAGSGTQAFMIGAVQAETLTGSTVSGATNFYNFEDAASTAGSTFTITDFGSNSFILLEGNGFNQSFGTSADTVSVSAVSSYGGSSSQITLTDGTVITLKGVSASHVNVLGGSQIITYQ
jgi:hypothetical protein